MSVAVLPRVRKIKFRFLSENQDDQGREEESRLGAGGGSGDIHQLREYTSGDSYRYIHWKQSARTDLLWVKEFQPEEETQADLYLDFQKEGTINHQKYDAFISILSAFILGLLEEEFSVSVSWEGKERPGEKVKVTNKKEHDDLLIYLYQTDDFYFSPGKARIPEKREEVFRMDRDLQIFYGKRKLLSFSEKTFEEELNEAVLVV
ncbi:MAG: DUF58 domain-containing protein [Ruminococcus sp.]